MFYNKGETAKRRSCGVLLYMTRNTPKFVIIDGNAIVHRAFHALPKLTSPEGTVVNSVYGFASLLIKVLRDIDPAYIAVTFDRKEPTFRHQMYKEYKATRKKAPDELYAQIPIIKDLLGVLKIKIYEKAGFEADDIIATLAKSKATERLKNIIITGDLDTLQLVGKNTLVYALRSGIKDFFVYNPKKVFERYGLRPDQLIDFKALRGDQSDNIPGVRGIGEKTAAELIKEFGTVEEIYSQLVKETKKTEKIREKVKKLLLQHKPDAYEGKELVKLIDTVPIDFLLADCKRQNLDLKKAVESFEGLGFKSLIKRLPELGIKGTEGETVPGAQTKLF
jgi:DNA polymerase-1